METAKRASVTLIMSDNMEWMEEGKSISFYPPCPVLQYKNAGAWGTLRMASANEGRCLQLRTKAMNGHSPCSLDADNRRELRDHLQLLLSHPKVNSLSLVCDQEGAQIVESICRELEYDCVQIKFGGRIVLT